MIPLMTSLPPTGQCVHGFTRETHPLCYTKFDPCKGCTKRCVR